MNINSLHKRGGYYEEINLMKGFAMFLAVVGHSLPDAVHGFNIIGENSFSEFIYHWIYSFHMSAFFFCAGFLFIPRLPYKKVGDIVYKRFMRLMIPYFFYSLTYLLLKTILGSFADHPLEENAFGLMLLGVSPSFGCWFLWVLFMISMIFTSMKHLNSIWLFVISIVLFFLSNTLDKTCIPGNIGGVLSGSLWFALGGLVGTYYDKVKQICHHPIFAVIGFCMLTLLQFVQSQNVILQCAISVAKTLGGILTIYGLACFLMERHTKSWVYKLTKLIGDYCMDIYLLSMFVLVPMRILYVNFGLMDYINYYVYVCIAVSFGILIPYICSKHVVRKIKLLRMVLIGG